MANVLPQPLVHPSAMAMGGAYTAIANDDSAPFTNPAGIARIKKARSRSEFYLLRSPQFFVGTNNIANYAELASLQGRHLLSAQGWDKDINGPYLQIGGLSKGMPDISNLDDDLQTLFKSNLDANIWGRFDIGFLGIFEIAKNIPISLGFYTTSEGSLTISDTSVSSARDIGATTQVRYSDVINIIPVIGIAFSNKSKRANYGLQIRPIVRQSYDGSNELSVYGDADQIGQTLAEGTNKDQAIAYDMGFMWTLADFWYPTLGIAMFNLPTGCDNYLNPYDQTSRRVCGTNFKSSTTINPNSLYNLDPTDIRIGISISPRLSRKMAIRLSFDYHYLEYKFSNYDFFQKFYLRNMHVYHYRMLVENINHFYLVMHVCYSLL